MATRAIPIGVDDFGKLLDPENNYLFADKSLMITDVIDNKQEIELILRPRRWGKTLNMSMLQYFFAPTVDGRSTQGMFDQLKIATEGGQAYMQYQGQYPVISISFKDLKASDFESAICKLSQVIQELYRTHKADVDIQKLPKEDGDLFQRLLMAQGKKGDLEYSLKFLSTLLQEKTGKPVYILIDEYDSPLTHAYQNDYFKEMVGVMRNLFSAALKGNRALKKGVLTGILRLAKEDLLSGLNNLKIHTLLDKPYSAYYGFTETETNELLCIRHLAGKAEEIKRWYNGYRFGEHTLYNPWSIINCLDDGGSIRPYWVNTAGHDLIRKALTKPDSDVRHALMRLLQGKSIQVFVYDRITYLDLTRSDKLWTLLLFSGYLNATGSVLDEATAAYQSTVVIPNQEVLSLYRSLFIHWLQEGWGNWHYQDLIEDLVAGDIERFIQALNRYLLESSSYHDTTHTGEAFYHGFVLGLVASIRNSHWVRSNRESGLGRYDVMIMPKPDSQYSRGILLEFKFTGADTDAAKLGELAQQALTQMTQQQYMTELQSQTQVKKILGLGLAFSPKQVIAQYRYIDCNE